MLTRGNLGKRSVKDYLDSWDCAADKFKQGFSDKAFKVLRIIDAKPMGHCEISYRVQLSDMRNVWIKRSQLPQSNDMQEMISRFEARKSKRMAKCIGVEDVTDQRQRLEDFSKAREELSKIGKQRHFDGDQENDFVFKQPTGHEATIEKSSTTSESENSGADKENTKKVHQIFQIQKSESSSLEKQDTLGHQNHQTKRKAGRAPKEKDVPFEQTEVGAFENNDVPLRILQIAFNGMELQCVVEWKQREDGYQPLHSVYSSEFLKSRCPRVLLDHYKQLIHLRSPQSMGQVY